MRERERAGKCSHIPTLQSACCRQPLYERKLELDGWNPWPMPIACNCNPFLRAVTLKLKPRRGQASPGTWPKKLHHQDRSSFAVHRNQRATCRLRVAAGTLKHIWEMPMAVDDTNDSPMLQADASTSSFLPLSTVRVKCVLYKVQTLCKSKAVRKPDHHQRMLMLDGCSSYHSDLHRIVLIFCTSTLDDRDSWPQHLSMLQTVL